MPEICLMLPQRTLNVVQYLPVTFFAIFVQIFAILSSDSPIYWRLVCLGPSRRSVLAMTIAPFVKFWLIGYTIPSKPPQFLFYSGAVFFVWLGNSTSLPVITLLLPIWSQSADITISIGSKMQHGALLTGNVPQVWQSAVWCLRYIRCTRPISMSKAHYSHRSFVLLCQPPSNLE